MLLCVWKLSPFQNSGLQQNIEFREEPTTPFITCLLIRLWICVIWDFFYSTGDAGSAQFISTGLVQKEKVGLASYSWFAQGVLGPFMPRLEQAMQNQLVSPVKQAPITRMASWRAWEAIILQKLIASEVVSGMLHPWAWHSDDHKANPSRVIKNLTFLSHKCLNHSGDSKWSLSHLGDSSDWVRLGLAYILYSYQCSSAKAQLPPFPVQTPHAYTRS